MFSPRNLNKVLAATLITGLAPFLAAAAMAEVGVPRTASGRPDLSGTYDAATVTPLARPEAFGDKLYLTAEEASKLEEAARLRRERSSRASDPNREAPPEGGDGSAGAAGGVGGYNSFWVDSGTVAFDIDGKFRTSILIDPKNGQMPPPTTRKGRG